MDSDWLPIVDSPCMFNAAFSPDGQYVVVYHSRIVTDDDSFWLEVHEFLANSCYKRKVGDFYEDEDMVSSAREVVFELFPECTELPHNCATTRKR